MNNRSLALVDLGRYDELLAGFRRTIELAPGFAEARWNHALTLLLLGDLARGWAEYEWRWRWEGFSEPVRPFRLPLWDGGNLAGKTILLHAEQGIGDTLQFIRYVPWVAECGGRVIVEVQPSVVRLARRIAGISEVIARGEPLPDFDAHLPIMSLPRVFGATMATIPNRVPYLSADATATEIWRARLAQDGVGLRIGLAWAGSASHTHDRWRSIPLSALARLGEAAGILLYSLQVGPAAEQANPRSTPMKLIDHTAHLSDFSETAALIANLDLVISVDTAVAHLAGAMGKRTWILLPPTPDWRWLLDRADSPWYPTVRLFRRPRGQTWDTVIQEVVGELQIIAQ